MIAGGVNAPIYTNAYIRGVKTVNRVIQFDASFDTQ